MTPEEAEHGRGGDCEREDGARLALLDGCEEARRSAKRGSRVGWLGGGVLTSSAAPRPIGRMGGRLRQLVAPAWPDLVRDVGEHLLTRASHLDQASEEDGARRVRPRRARCAQEREVDAHHGMGAERVHHSEAQLIHHVAESGVRTLASS